MKFIRTHDHIYLSENRYKKPKEMFKFIEKKAFKKKEDHKKKLICDFGCAAGEFLYYLKKKRPGNEYVGTDIRLDLLKKAKKFLPTIKFLKKSVLKKKSFPAKIFHKSFLCGVHPIFDEFEKCFSNLIYWTKNAGEIFIFDMFNPYPVDVLIKYRNSTDYNKRKNYESGWNNFSRKSVSIFLKKQHRVKNFSFHEFEMPFDLKRQKDPVRSWTIKSKNKRLMINGLNIIQPQTLLIIRLRK